MQQKKVTRINQEKLLINRHWEDHNYEATEPNNLIIHPRAKELNIYFIVIILNFWNVVIKRTIGLNIPILPINWH